MKLRFRTALALLGLILPLSAAEPRLILVISVDQMRFDYLTRFEPLFKDGFKTLLDRGAVFTNAKFRHSRTETGPGHSVILTGRHGSHSGIVGNDWWDSYLKKTVNVVEDPVQTTIGGPGRAASPDHLIGFTVGDKIKQKWPDSKVFGISIKDRSAILMAGRRGDGAFWFENACGCFITSSYYTKEAPGWLTAFNARKLPDQYADKPWTRLLPDESIYEKHAGIDKAPGENDLRDTTFPHAFASKPPASGYYSAFTKTPYADEVLLKAALQLISTHQLGSDASPDVLAVGFSAPDTIGHSYGAYSQEEMDEFLRLDGILGQLFKAAETAAGASNLLVVLTADHGSLPLVEWLQAHATPDARRSQAAVVNNTVKKVLAERFPTAPNLIANFSSPDFYFDLDAIQKAGLNRADVEKAASEALLATGMVQAVYTQADLMRAPSGQDDPYIALVRNSFFAPRSPHLTVIVKKNVFLGGAGGTGHGTVHDYDRHVPIVWMGAGIPKGQYSAESGPEDIAPTLAKMLGIPFPMEHDSRLLTEILK